MGRAAQQDNYINSQIAEQFNSSLKYIRTQVTFMKQEHYLLFTKHFIALLNENKQKNPTLKHRFAQRESTQATKQREATQAKSNKRKHM